MRTLTRLFYAVPTLFLIVCTSLLPLAAVADTTCSAGQANVSLSCGASGGASLSGTNTWTGTQTFIDAAFFVVDDGDNTKKIAFQASSITAGNTRTLTVPDRSAIIALTSTDGSFLNASAGGYSAAGGGGVQPDAGNPFRIGAAGAEFLEWSSAVTGFTAGKTLTDAVATSLVQLSVSSNAATGARIDWTVTATDGTDFQSVQGSTYLAVVNKAGTETCTVGDVGTMVTAVSSGTLTVTTSCDTTPANAVNLMLTADSSFATPTIRGTSASLKSGGGAFSTP